MLLAIASYFAIASDYKERGIANAQLKPLHRMRYHALSLAGMYARDHLAANEYGDVARSSSKFKEFFDAFSYTARLALVTQFQQAVDEGSTTYAFVRSDERWEQIRKMFAIQLAAI